VCTGEDIKSTKGEPLLIEGKSTFDAQDVNSSANDTLETSHGSTQQQENLL
jgi:hypothetical protein